MGNFLISLEFIEALSSFYKDISKIAVERFESERLTVKTSKLTMKDQEFIYRPPIVNEGDFQNIGKLSKKFGESQAYQYSDKTSNQLNGETD